MAQFTFGLSEIFTEGYRVEQTVDVRCDKGFFRIEAIAVLRGRATDFTAWYYQLQHGHWRWIVLQQPDASTADEAVHLALATLETYLAKRGASL